MFIGLVIFKLYDGVAPYLTEKIGGRHAYSNNTLSSKEATLRFPLWPSTARAEI